MPPHVRFYVCLMRYCTSSTHRSRTLAKRELVWRVWILCMTFIVVHMTLRITHHKTKNRRRVSFCKSESDIASTPSTIFSTIPFPIVRWHRCFCRFGFRRTNVEHFGLAREAVHSATHSLAVVSAHARYVNSTSSVWRGRVCRARDSWHVVCVFLFCVGGIGSKPCAHHFFNNKGTVVVPRLRRSTRCRAAARRVLCMSYEVLHILHTPVSHFGEAGIGMAGVDLMYDIHSSTYDITYNTPQNKKPTSSQFL